MTRKRRGRGEGGIRYREDKDLWVGEVRLPTGKRKTVYGKTKGEVQDKIRDLEQKARSGLLFEAATMKVKDYLERWLAGKAGTVAPSTIDGYEGVVNTHLIPRLGLVRLDRLTPLHVEGLFAELTRDGVSGGNRQKIHEVLVNALNHAVRLKLLPCSPAAGQKRPRVEQTEMKILDGDQVKAFLAAARGDRFEALYLEALYGGLRQGELLGQHWPDIDFDRGQLSVRRSLDQTKCKFTLKEPKSKRSRRTIDVPRVVMDALHEHRKAMLAEGHDVKAGPVFCSTTGGFVDKSNLVHRSFWPILTRAGLDIRFHDLRHTHASHLLARNVPLKDVSLRLGHASEALTLKVYTHLLPTAGEELRRKLEGLYG